eukprot:gene5841-6082_t
MAWVCCQMVVLVLVLVLVVMLVVMLVVGRVGRVGERGAGSSDINSPLRHVRTRIYFTSESHIHSLINVPVESPERFFVEIQFSNGANFDPTTTVPPLQNHILPTQVTLARLAPLWKP